jgi:hypothetical protein
MPNWRERHQPVATDPPTIVTVQVSFGHLRVLSDL